MFHGTDYLPYILQAVGKCFFFFCTVFRFVRLLMLFPVAFSLAISNTHQRNMVLYFASSSQVRIFDRRVNAFGLTLHECELLTMRVASLRGFRLRWGRRERVASRVKREAELAVPCTDESVSVAFRKRI